MYVLSIIKQIYAILNTGQKRKLLFMQIFFAFSAMVQVFGVASIAPLIALIANPDSIHQNRFFLALYESGDFTNSTEFIIYFAVVSIFMIIISNLVNTITLWVQLKFSISLGSGIQKELFSSFIHREYLFHKSINYNQLIALISVDTPRFIYMVLQPYLLLCSQLFVAVVILVGLLTIDPIIAIGSAAIVGLAYVVTYWFVKKSLKRHGDIIQSRNSTIQALLSESFIGIKDIKLNAVENVYLNKYQHLITSGLNSSAYLSLAAEIPRYAVETISFCAILLFAILLISSNTDSTSIVSILSVYALAGYKLLPTMQQLYKSISQISANGNVVEAINENLSLPIETRQHVDVNALSTVESVSADHISYQYPNTPKLALENVSVTFSRGNLNTIAGPSGSGKSTLADILLGLLSPKSGILKIDSQPADMKLLISYQKSLGYVPQHIFILDDDVAANVAFGSNKSDIDEARVLEALKMANALEFVEKLPSGIHTVLGQDGKTLSGGQRQRIGIARALYRNNKILILDEPTSALDIESEHDLMMLLNNLKRQILIIVISHRPAAIKLSDTITLIADGKMVAHGAYETLYNESEYFKLMISKGFME